MLNSRNLTKQLLSKMNPSINPLSSNITDIKNDDTENVYDEQFPTDYEDPDKIVSKKEKETKSKQRSTPFLEKIDKSDIIYISNDEFNKNLPDLLSKDSQQFSLEVHCCFYSIHTTHIYPYLSYIVETDPEKHTCHFPQFKFTANLNAQDEETIQTELLNEAINILSKCCPKYIPSVDFRENVYRGFLPIDETSMYLFFQIPPQSIISPPYLISFIDELISNGKVFDYVFDERCQRLFYIQDMRFSYILQELENGDKKTIDIPYVVYHCINKKNDGEPTSFAIEETISVSTPEQTQVESTGEETEYAEIIEQTTSSLVDSIGEMEMMQGLTETYYFFTSNPFPESASIETVRRYKRYILYPVDYVDCRDKEFQDGDIVLNDDDTEKDCIYFYRENGTMQFWGTQNVSTVEPVLSYEESLTQLTILKTLRTPDSEKSLTNTDEEYLQEQNELGEKDNDELEDMENNNELGEKENNIVGENENNIVGENENK